LNWPFASRASTPPMTRGVRMAMARASTATAVSQRVTI
jgi:hypothetical protein